MVVPVQGIPARAAKRERAAETIESVVHGYARSLIQEQIVDVIECPGIVEFDPVRPSNFQIFFQFL
jgi:hypothetical protein